MLVAVSGPARDALVGLAGLAAGFANGVAGGGTLLSFPALLGLGLPALSANVTSTVGAWSSYLGGSTGFRAEIGAQRSRVARLAPATLGGAVVGSVLLLTTPNHAFRDLAPYLILAGCALFAAQPVIARRAGVDPADGKRPRRSWLLDGGVFLASVYGAYFGAGLGVILLAVLGLALPDTLVRTNGLRAVLSLLVNTLAAIVFAVHAPVDWTAAGLLAAGCLIGGYAGARSARVIPATVLRVVVVLFGVAAAARLLA